MIETLRFGIFTLDPALQGVSVVNKLAQPVRVFSGKKCHADYVTGLSSVCYQLYGTIEESEWSISAKRVKI